MQAINQYAHANTKLKVVTNLYYPGYAADNALANCTDSAHRPAPEQAEHLPAVASPR